MSTTDAPPMQRLGDLMHQTPTPEQAEATNHVLEVALSWQAGGLSLDAVNDLCTGFERWQAIRFADPTGDGYHALRALVDAFVNADRAILQTQSGIVISEELHAGWVKRTTNWEGRRVLVWPLYFMDLEPYYPAAHLPHGAERRGIEEAMLKTYDAYMKSKRRENDRGRRD